MTGMSGSRADALGKAFELALAGCFVAMAEVHHRRDDGADPISIYSRIRDTVGTEVVDRVEAAATDVRPELMVEFSRTGFALENAHVSSVAWVSQPADYEAFAGFPEANTKADLLFSNTTGGICPVSCKIHGTSPTWSNLGIENLEATVGIPGQLTPLVEEHSTMVAEAYPGMTRGQAHSTWKSEKDTDRGRKVRERAYEVRCRMAGMVRAGLESRGSEGIREVVRDCVAPETKVPEVVADVKLRRDGHLVAVHDARSWLDDRLSEYGGFHVRADQRGSTASIYAEGPSGSVEKVAHLGVKGRSGPVTNMNATFQAPFLGLRRKPRRRVAVFDLDLTLFRYEYSDGRHPMAKVWRNDCFDRVDPDDLESRDLRPGEVYDFHEFTDAELFAEGAVPIPQTFDLYRSLTRKGYVSYLLTARHRFDDPTLFEFTLNRHGFDVPLDRMLFSGERRYEFPTRAACKVAYVEGIIASERPDDLVLVDDDGRNLEAFDAMTERFPDVRFDLREVSSTRTGGHKVRKHVV